LEHAEMAHFWPSKKGLVQNRLFSGNIRPFRADPDPCP
jgi:hypothetical protein